MKKSSLFRWGSLFAIAVVVSAVTSTVFAPRFYLWDYLNHPAFAHEPEVNRAGAVLMQSSDLSVSDFGQSNQAIRWRLLFPALAHLLHLPDRLLLSLPFVGILWALAYSLRLLRFRDDPIYATGAAMLICSCSWFFVSSGWLSYNDSWLVLAMIVYAFNPRSWARILACGLVVWVDERFLFQVPLLLLIRHLHFHRSPAEWLVTLKEGMWEMCAVIPYAGLRLLSISGGNDIGASMIASTQYKRGWPWSEIAYALWEGLRFAWVAIPVALFVSKRLSRVYAVGLVSLACLSISVNVAVADDASRVASVLIPLVLFSVILIREEGGRIGMAVVLGLAVSNFVAPAHHVVVGAFTREIMSLPHETSRSAHFSTINGQGRAFYSTYSANEGNRMLAVGKDDVAAVYFLASLDLNPADASAHRGLALVHFKARRYAESLRHIRPVVSSDQALADDWVIQGVCEVNLGMVEEGRFSLRTGLGMENFQSAHVRDMGERKLISLAD